MNQRKPRESYVPSQTQPVDWTAVKFLQSKRRTTHDEFKIDSIEYALDAVLKSPKRMAIGEQLAQDLFRDGKRMTSARKGLTGRSLINRETYEFLEPKVDYQVEVRDESISIAINIVSAAFNTLSAKEALALYIRTTGIDNSEDIGKILGVTVRQYRNLFNQARVKLRTYSGFRESYFLLYINSDETDIKDFFTLLMNDKFNDKLS